MGHAGLSRPLAVLKDLGLSNMVISSRFQSSSSSIATQLTLAATVDGPLLPGDSGMMVLSQIQITHTPEKMKLALTPTWTVFCTPQVTWMFPGVITVTLTISRQLSDKAQQVSLSPSWEPSTVIPLVSLPELIVTA